ncbi:hypothetical protein T439DRAFT_156281 [Meredithblackwellia eburnea MCA 4105]
MLTVQDGFGHSDSNTTVGGHWVTTVWLLSRSSNDSRHVWNNLGCVQHVQILHCRVGESQFSDVGEVNGRIPTQSRSGRRGCCDRSDLLRVSSLGCQWPKQIHSRFACGGTYITFAYQIQQWRKHYTWGVLIWLGSAAVSDLLITGSIVYYLRKAQKTSSFHETNSLLDKIIRSTMENNLLTACVALMDGITFASNGTSWHITMNQVLPKLYTLSFIITLNARVPTSDLASNHPSTRARSLQQGPDLTMTNSMVKSRISGSHADHRPKPSPILVDFPSYRWSGKFSRTEIFPLIVLSGNNVSLTSSGRRARLFLTKKRFSAEWQRFGSSNPQSTNNKRSTL